MPKPKVSGWEPAGLGILKLDEICPDSFFTDLIQTHLGSGSDDRHQKIKIRLRNILGIFRSNLHYERRPSPGSKSVAIERLVALIAETKDHLNGMDEDSRSLIKIEAYGDRTAPGWEDGALFQKDFVAESEKHLEALGIWARAAASKINVAQARGRNPQAAEKSAVESLLKLWKDYATGPTRPKNPSSEVFHPFVLSALTPVRNLVDISTNSNLRGIVNRVLTADRAQNKLG